MTIKILKISILMVIILVINIGAIIVWLMRPFENDIKVVDIHNKEYFIAHAAGGINGYTYTNSKEALLSSIEKGYKYIEMDLYLTTDSQVVCLHAPKEYNMMTGSSVTELDSHQFMKSKLYGKFTPMHLEEAVKIWENNNFVFVTDKFSDPDVLDYYFRNGKENLLVEVRRFWNYNSVKKHGYNAMLTTPGGFLGLIKYLCAYCCDEEHQINYVVTPKGNNRCYLRFYKRLGSEIAVFHENDSIAIQKLLQTEVDKIYTDTWSSFN